MTSSEKKSDKTRIEKKTGMPRDAGIRRKMEKAHESYSATEGKEATGDTPADRTNGRK
jgi:hypothetical protein